MTKAPRLRDLILKDPERIYIKICPDLTEGEIHKVMTIGGSDVQIPVVHCCVLSECAAYDLETDTCKKYGQKVTYTKGGEAID
ncbi:MAG: hypothetical protein SOI56_06635 [Eubacteriales bacterium]